MQIKRAGWIRESHYNVEMEGWMQKDGNMMCKLIDVNG